MSFYYHWVRSAYNAINIFIYCATCMLRDDGFGSAGGIMLDLNLLLALDALLSEGSVAGAAKRMNLSPPAMSRQLSRIRHLLRDPVLVRAGRGLVPTPRAEALRDRLRQLIIEAEALVRGDRDVDLAALDKTFTVRSGDGFVASFGAAIAATMAIQVPNARLRFIPQGNEDVQSVRDGTIDLDIGVMGELGPEVRLQTLFHDHFIAVVRREHPLLGQTVKLESLVSYPFVSVSRRGRFNGPLDDVLASVGHSRMTSLAVPSMSDALSVVAFSDCIATVPARLSKALRQNLSDIDVPLQTDPIVISMAWHPRYENDPANRWLRSCVRKVVLEK
ncbi:LysR family transcriptional regulator [Rhizobium panacihumi]|uniref:LysR family transcriptional regulator n=1 Tax=Rhizobium panacihumi TaxID=2008450 RepID=UPI003D7A40E2